jgi:hypothetical protein
MFHSTPKQRAASRANAQKSTGPRTAAGKAASRFNALKHGIFAVHQIMFDEKPEDLAELTAEYLEQDTPANSKERFLIDMLVHNEWRLRRMRRVEAALWQTASNAFLVQNIETTVTCTSGDAFATDSATFESLQRVVNACERAYYKALKELQYLQAARTAAGANPGAPPQKPLTAEPSPQPEQSKADSASSASFCETPQPHAPAAAQPRPDPPPAGPAAPASPAESHPPAADRDPNASQTIDRPFRPFESA